VWNATRDIVTQDSDGDLWFVDSLSGFVRTHHGPVSTRRVEDALYSLVDVTLAAVWGEGNTLVAAITSLRPVTDVQISQALQTLAPYERPAQVHRSTFLELTDGFRANKYIASRAHTPSPTPLDALTSPNWKPRDVATLLFVIRNGQCLLIRKKRGLGAGKISAPGGRLEPGETPLACALRETQEEVGVTPLVARQRGELRFQFADGYTLQCFVFTSDGCEGEARETDEALPMWVHLHEVPYGEMWQDDAVWLPKMFSGYSFVGHFLFDGDTMGEHTVAFEDPATPLFARLNALNIAHTTYSHPPVFTVEQAQQHRNTPQGVHVKNLFLRNKKGAMYLVTVREDRVIDLKILATKIGAGHVSFASPDRLRTFLGVEAGSVTPFAAMCDREHKVTVCLDRAVAEAEWVCCHPLANDRTTTVSASDLLRFLRDTGHEPKIMDL
jgi:8-oxo-dGTP pyrophosphatase MutT (NUDIX family)